MTAAKTSKTAKTTKASPSKAARKTAPKSGAKTSTSKAKAKPTAESKPQDEPDTQPSKRDDGSAAEPDGSPDDVVVDCAERAADNQVRELVTTTPLYMRTLLDLAPGWYAADEDEVVDERADRLTSDLLLLGGTQ